MGFVFGLLLGAIAALLYAPKPGDNTRAKCELRRQLLVVQTERLEKARSTVGQMKGEQKQTDDVKGRDVNVLESINHH